MTNDPPWRRHCTIQIYRSIVDHEKAQNIKKPQKRDEKDEKLAPWRQALTVRVHNKRFGQYIHYSFVCYKVRKPISMFFSGNYLVTPHSVFKMMLIVKSKIRKWARTIYEKVIAKKTPFLS